MTKKNKLNSKDAVDDRPALCCSPLPPRKKLKRGNRYQFLNSTNYIEIIYVVFRGHEEDDGGAQGVAIDWIRNGKKQEGGFYPCKSDEAFFSLMLFSNAYDPQLSSAL